MEARPGEAVFPEEVYPAVVCPEEVRPEEESRVIPAEVRVSGEKLP